MSKRSWLLGVGALVLIGLLLACGSNYNASQDGLLLVGSQGSGLIETFSFTLSNGHISAIANTPTDTSSQTCVLNGLPGSMVMDPAGVYAYAILLANSSCSGSKTGIAAFKVSSDGNITQAGSLVSLASANVLIQGTTTSEAVGVVPSTMSMDTAGKFLFVAERPPKQSSVLFLVQFRFAIGSGASIDGQRLPFVQFREWNRVSVAFNIVASRRRRLFSQTLVSAECKTLCALLLAITLRQLSFSMPWISVGYHGIRIFGRHDRAVCWDSAAGNNLVPGFPADNVPLGVAVDPLRSVCLRERQPDQQGQRVPSLQRCDAANVRRRRRQFSSNSRFAFSIGRRRE